MSNPGVPKFRTGRSLHRADICIRGNNNYNHLFYIYWPQCENISNIGYQGGGGGAGWPFNNHPMTFNLS